MSEAHQTAATREHDATRYDAPSRRAVLRSAAQLALAGGLSGGIALMVLREGDATRDGDIGRCINLQRCNGCRVLSRCSLPDARQYRRQQTAATPPIPGAAVSPSSATTLERSDLDATFESRALDMADLTRGKHTAQL